MLNYILYGIGFFIGLLIFAYIKDFIEVIYYNAKERRQKND